MTGSDWLTHAHWQTKQAEARRPPWLAGSTPPRLTPLLLESVPSNGVTLGGVHGMVTSASPCCPRRDRGRAGSPRAGGVDRTAGLDDWRRVD